MGRNRIFVIFLLLALLAFWFAVSPPRWWLNLTKSVDLTNPAETGRRLAEQYDCRQCHTIDGRGALKAPGLAGITERLDSVSIRLWLRNPRAVKGNTAMPNFHLSDTEIEAIIAYLQSQ